MAAPTPAELQHLTRGELRDRLWRSFGGAEPVYPWPGPVADLYYGWLSLGRDVNGVSLHLERGSWLRENGWGSDPGELEAGQYLFLVLENEMGRVREELHPTKG